MPKWTAPAKTRSSRENLVCKRSPTEISYLFFGKFGVSGVSARRAPRHLRAGSGSPSRRRRPLQNFSQLQLHQQSAIAPKLCTIFAPRFCTIAVRPPASRITATSLRPRQNDHEPVHEHHNFSQLFFDQNFCIVPNFCGTFPSVLSNDANQLYVAYFPLKLLGAPPHPPCAMLMAGPVKPKRRQNANFSHPKTCKVGGSRNLFFIYFFH